MFKSLLFASLLVIASGCTSPGCFVQDKAAEVGANVVSSVLECSKVAELKQDLNDQVLSKTGLCKAAEDESKQGVLADTFCPVIADGIVTFAKSQGAGFLAKYDCKATNVSTLLHDKILAACKQIPLAPKP